MAREAAYEDRVDDRSGGMSGVYAAEHSLAWVVALGALVLVAIGLLVGFGVIGGDTEIAGTGTDVTGATEDITGTTDLVNWQEGMLWIVPAISLGILAFTLHDTDHHRARRRSQVSGQADKAGAMFGTEHGLAYLMALAAIAAGTLGILVGFDVFDNANTFEDGMLWSFASLVPAALAATLHNVRHHQVAPDEDVIVRMIEERTGPRTTTTAPRTERVADRPGERPL